MTQIREGNPLTTERAEQMLIQAGGQLGNWLGLARLYCQQTAQTFRQEAVRMDLPASVSTSQTKRMPTERPALEKAEEVVEQLEQWAVIGSLQMKKTIACLREDAEDIYVEAQDMSARWKAEREPAE
ncbi:hypothetical protein KDW_53330 [Dictyobacter vulcani]|uniref:Uncharacterized protein n=1 Tax=Dictyobacter vulcani TaxID=2607529 RepID=A0A5J4KXG3_9CHLR|nr:hypothetical protein [Dictyobacter vulcani]GER91171.1 hypothetical protein KDW_53330 [Dictyobacter vulcani]